MYVGPQLIGTAHASYTLYVYRCDECTAEYRFETPQTAPFRCRSSACDWSMISTQSEQPLDRLTAPPMAHPQRGIPGIDETAPCEAGCGPHIHTGPHWLHMDRLDREENMRLLRYAVDHQLVAVARYVAGAELRRLAAKAHQMQALGLWPQAEEPL